MNTLTPTVRILAWCLHALVVALLGLAVVRAFADSAPDARAVAVAAAVTAVTYGLGPLLPIVGRSYGAAVLWLSAVGAVWLVLLTISAEAVWVAFPLYFVQLHLLPRRSGLVAVLLTTLAAVVGFSIHQGAFTPATAIGPSLGAAVAVAVVWAYQTLYRESEQRRMLIDELTATRADLAAAQHSAGVLEERERLAREIHDTLAQGLSSIQLLLRAAERAMPERLDAAAGYIGQARAAAVDNLGEARRFVAALTPPGLDGTTLAGALERLCATTSGRHPIVARFHLRGTPIALPTAYEVALLRVVQSALANSVRHSGAATVDVTLGFDEQEVVVDIVDDGSGFDPDSVPVPGPERGGFGLAAMRARTHALGGAFVVRSAPGEGTTVSARLPRPPEPSESRP
ncbi:sensor histidine kinase [Rhodococcus sp. NPDC047139]|uniref:sensor histidine kinase n=1 Tax=Rhodococcus sp. NPDC047139 TaxID=3155141 RepID=UPI0033C44F41